MPRLDRRRLVGPRHRGHRPPDRTRNLWDRVEATHQAWEEHDGPSRDRFGLTITADGQTLWVDTPEAAIPSAN
ncbi:hypothetical protein ACWF95_38535 [Streptomyces vinaceus]